ncbi:myoneurin isoform X2 [Alosa sapidissima]|uniref:myoneurin isoform X2 n=1 Tax=Alosa sapidissima TaxID=34773 RepID=UPI001C09F7A1|nr:myoneurin isoform X2 [Alosa sapidissima]
MPEDKLQTKVCLLVVCFVHLSRLMMTTLVHAELLLEQLKKQRERGFLCDCTIVIGPSRYQAHRNVLAAFSEFFASRSALEGEGVTTITLDPEWVTEATFQRLLTFVYTGNLNIDSNDDISDIRKAAAFLGMQEVLNQCDRLCQNDEKPSLEAIIQACNAVAAAEAAAEATAEAIAECSAPSPEPVDMLPPLAEVEESEEQESTEQSESQEKLSPTPATSESSPPKEQAASTGKRGRKPKPKPSVETPAVEESSSPKGTGRGRGRPSGRGRGRAVGRGRGRGRPPKKVTVEPASEVPEKVTAEPVNEMPEKVTAEPASDMPAVEAEPSNEMPVDEQQTEQQGEPTSSMDDCEFTPDGEDDDPLNPAKIRKSNRKRVPSKKLKESSDYAAVMKVEVGECEEEEAQGDEEMVEMMEMVGEDTLLGAGSRQLGKSRPICSSCGKVFSELSSLRRHMRIHKGLKPYECQLCNRTFRQGNQLKTHLRIHTGEKPFKCDKCDKSFAQKCQLVFHCRMHHGEEKPYQCNDCGLQFATSSNLKIHCRKHSGEKPYNCELCGKCFAQASTLTYHMRRHTGEKPYVCDTCGRAFAVSSSLITHSRKHAKEKLKKAEEEATSNAPYLCLVCGKRFFTTGELRKHMDSHGYKRVRCDLCGQMFADPSGLKRHKEKKHGAAVEIEETLTTAAVPLNIPIDHQGLIARMCASPLNPTGVTFEQLEIPADTAASMETTQIVIVHTIEAE